MCWIFLAPLFWPYDTVSVIKNRWNSWGNNGAGAAPVPYGLDFEEGQEEAVSTRWRETKWEIRSGSPCCRGGNSQSVNTWDLGMTWRVSSRKICSIDVKSIGTFEYIWHAQHMCSVLYHEFTTDESRDPDAPGFGKHNSWQLSGFHRGRCRLVAQISMALCYVSHHFFWGNFKLLSAHDCHETYATWHWISHGCWRYLKIESDVLNAKKNPIFSVSFQESTRRSWRVCWCVAWSLWYAAYRSEKTTTFKVFFLAVEMMWSLDLPSLTNWNLCYQYSPWVLVSRSLPGCEIKRLLGSSPRCWKQTDLACPGSFESVLVHPMIQSNVAGWTNGCTGNHSKYLGFWSHHLEMLKWFMLYHGAAWWPNAAGFFDHLICHVMANLEK